LLVTKISLVAVILRLAAQNRRTLLGRRSRMSDSSSRLKRTLVRASLIELALGAAVIAVTAVMVASSPT
jgi:putative copper export protein